MKVLNRRYDPACPIDEIRPHPRNPRSGDIGSICESIDDHGFYGVVLVQESTGFILAGSHRHQAAAHHHAETIPVMWVDCADEEALKILLADNKTSDLASYDNAALADLLKSVQTSYTLAGTGWDDDALDDLLNDLARGYVAAAVSRPEPPNCAQPQTAGTGKPAVTQLPPGKAKGAREQGDPVNPREPGFFVQVAAQNELHQSEILADLETQGYKCKPVTF